jgi:hypothetical protein
MSDQARIEEREKEENTLRPENREALRLLKEWTAIPDDKGDEWWDEFERLLEEHRFSLRGKK